MTFVWVATHQARSEFASVAFACNGCHNLIGKKIVGRVDMLSAAKGTLEDYEQSLIVIDTYPRVSDVSAPDSIPEAAKRVFVQAEESAARGYFDAAGSMYRKALEVSTRALNPDLADLKLQKRIDALHAAGRLTDDLKDWAHIIRLDGNESVHDDEALGPVDIEALASFTKLFLTYTFTLPVQVQIRRAEADAVRSAAVQA